ncbi:MAG: hypothetical protein KAH18_04270, partial [Psychromonas sp.]|nr:hypothetical protein [Psychromonas sp.]
ERSTAPRIWAPKGTRSSAIHQQQFEYDYIVGGTCPAQDKALGLVLPLENTNGMIEHLGHHGTPLAK